MVTAEMEVQQAIYNEAKLLSWKIVSIVWSFPYHAAAPNLQQAKTNNSKDDKPVRLIIRLLFFCFTFCQTQQKISTNSETVMLSILEELLTKLLSRCLALK